MEMKQNPRNIERLRVIRDTCASFIFDRTGLNLRFLTLGKYYICFHLDTQHFFFHNKNFLAKCERNYDSINKYKFYFKNLVIKIDLAGC